MTLVGFSLGARVIFYALLEMARLNAFGIVEDVVLCGAPVTADADEWELAVSVVGGRFVNCYHTHDWVLGFLYRAMAFKPIAGLAQITYHPSIENMDVSLELKGHTSYRNAMPRLLAMAGIPVTSEEFQEPETEEERLARETKEREEKEQETFNQVVHDLRTNGMQVREIPTTLPKMVLMGGGHPIVIKDGKVVVDMKAIQQQQRSKTPQPPQNKSKWKEWRTSWIKKS